MTDTALYALQHHLKTLGNINKQLTKTVAYLTEENMFLKERLKTQYELIIAQSRESQRQSCMLAEMSELYAAQLASELQLKDCTKQQDNQAELIKELSQALNEGR